MKLNRTWLIAALTAALAALGVGTALATSQSAAVNEHAEAEDNENNDAADHAAEGEDTPISDQDALEQASQAALAWLKTEHGTTGTVSATEAGDEESYYEIEVTLDDGRQVDVQLTRDFEVVGLD